MTHDRRLCNIGEMDEPLAHLPEAYARYFALRRAGRPQHEIAEQLGVPPEAMESFVQIADSKIANATDTVQSQMQGQMQGHTQGQGEGQAQ
jgi:DNA-directed RNA polymerase specialized sigma24 family protein